MFICILEGIFSHKNSWNLNCFAMLSFNFVEKNLMGDLDTSQFNLHVVGIKEINVREVRMRV